VDKKEVKHDRRSSGGNLTVTPIKILCRQNNKRLSSLDRTLKIKKKFSAGRPRDRPVSNNKISCSFASSTPSSETTSTNKQVPSVGSGRRRGRPPGSKKKVVVAHECNKSDVGMVKRSANDSPPDHGVVDLVLDGSSLQKDSNSERTEYSPDENGRSPNKTRSFWQPPADPKVRRLLDRVSITDVTINAFTITVRESSTVDGFFKSDVDDGMQSNFHSSSC